MRIIFVIIGSDSPLPKRERFTECLRKHFANCSQLLGKTSAQMSLTSQTVSFGISYFSKLKGRRIISVNGKDSKNVLQGLQTNDMNYFLGNDTKAALYSQFLNPQGRIINDAIIIRPQIVVNGQVKCKENEFWIDVDSKQASDLIRHVKKYCLRKRVQVNDYSKEVQVTTIYSDLVLPKEEKQGDYWSQIDQSTYENTDKEVYTQVSYVDPRTSHLGIRCIIPTQDSLAIDQTIAETTEEQYNQKRLLLGIPQGLEVVDRLPFTVNVDFMKGVAFNKGCYVGQELTARTYHTGIVRRRVVPFIISESPLEMYQDDLFNPSALPAVNPEFKDSLEGESLLDKKSNEIGKIIANIGNIGIAAVKYLDKGPKFEDRLFTTSKQLKGQLFYSQWLNQNISEYIQLINEKEAKSALF